MSDLISERRFYIGSTISQIFSVIYRNIVSIGILCFLSTVASMALTHISSVAIVQISSSTRLVLISAVSVIWSLGVNSILVGCVTWIVVNDAADRQTKTVVALGVGLRSLLPVVGLSIVVSLMVGLASLLLIVPGLMLGLRWIVAVPSLVVERAGIGRALSRSAELTSGHRWKLFGLTFIYLMVSVLILFLITFGMAWISGGFAKPIRASVSFNPVAFALSGISTLVQTAIGSTGIATTYVVLRRIEDGAMPSETSDVFA